MALTVAQIKNEKSTDKPVKLSDGGGLFLLIMDYHYDKSGNAMSSKVHF